MELQSFDVKVEWIIINIICFVEHFDYIWEGLSVLPVSFREMASFIIRKQKLMHSYSTIQSILGFVFSVKCKKDQTYQVFVILHLLK